MKGLGVPTLTPCLGQILEALLPIDEYVPPSLDPGIVRKVILAFLRPGNRVPALGGGYVSFVDLCKDLRGVSSGDVDEILKWLSKIDVLLVRLHKKPGRKLLSLRIHRHGIAFPGGKIIGIIASAAYEKARMG